MGYNLTVWAWADSYDTAAARKKKKIKYDNVIDGFARDGNHPAMREFDFTKFEAAVESEFGPEESEEMYGPYILERYPHARNYNMPFSQVPRLVSRIGTIARQHGLTSAGR